MTIKHNDSNNPTFTDSTGRVAISRYTKRMGGQERHLWSLRVDGAWLGHFGGGLKSVAGWAANYTRLGNGPTLNAEVVFVDLNKDMVIKGLEEACGSSDR